MSGGHLPSSLPTALDFHRYIFFNPIEVCQFALIDNNLSQILSIYKIPKMRPFVIKSLNQLRESWIFFNSSDLPPIP